MSMGGAAEADKATQHQGASRDQGPARGTGPARGGGAVQGGGVADDDGAVRRRLTQLGVLAGIAGPIGLWLPSVVVIAAWPGYDPISQSISLLATAPLGWLQTAAFAVAGVLALAWAYAFPNVLGAPERPGDRAAVRVLLFIQAVIGLGFAILPTDPQGTPTTMIGAFHLIDFYAYAVTMPITLLGLGLVMRRDPRWHGSVRPTLLAASLAIASIALVPVTIDGPLTPWLGLLERAFVAIQSIWQLGAGLVAWRLLHASAGEARGVPASRRSLIARRARPSGRGRPPTA
jgi:hypothetical protein